VLLFEDRTAPTRRFRFGFEGFYFNEDKGIAVTTDYVDLTAAATVKVAVENLVAVSAQKAAGQFLTALPKA
jgi:hypothetical protein